MAEAKAVDNVRARARACFALRFRRQRSLGTCAASIKQQANKQTSKQTNTATQARRMEEAKKEFEAEQAAFRQASLLPQAGLTLARQAVAFMCAAAAAAERAEKGGARESKREK